MSGDGIIRRHGSRELTETCEVPDGASQEVHNGEKSTIEVEATPQGLCIHSSKHSILHTAQIVGQINDSEKVVSGGTKTELPNQVQDVLILPDGIPCHTFATFGKFDTGNATFICADIHSIVMHENKNKGPSTAERKRPTFPAVEQRTRSDALDHISINPAAIVPPNRCVVVSSEPSVLPLSQRVVSGGPGRFTRPSHSTVTYSRWSAISAPAFAMRSDTRRPPRARRSRVTYDPCCSGNLALNETVTVPPRPRTESRPSSLAARLAHGAEYNAYQNEPVRNQFPSPSIESKSKSAYRRGFLCGARCPLGSVDGAPSFVLVMGCPSLSVSATYDAGAGQRSRVRGSLTWAPSFPGACTNICGHTYAWDMLYASSYRLKVPDAFT
ncbi:hypothetical protein V8D89_008562 [Ganoderma adspersum]